MELRQLKYFSAVAQQLSFTNAASMLFVSQSAISQQISALESELGIQLLTRDKHAVSLTQAGKEFYQNLQHILASLDDAVESAQATDRARHYAARMTIGVQESITLTDSMAPMIRALRATQAEFPFLIVDALRVEFDQVEPILLSGRADAVVALDPVGKKSPFSRQIQRRVMFREKLLLSIDRQRLAADYGDAPPDAHALLARYPLNLVSGDGGLIQQVFDIYRQYDLLPKISYFNNALESILRARLGYGMCLTPETLVSDPVNQEFLAFIPLEAESAYVSRNLLWRGGNIPAPLQFLLDRLWPETAH